MAKARARRLTITYTYVHLSIKDPKKQQWKVRTSIKWVLNHRIGENGFIRLKKHKLKIIRIIFLSRLRMYEEGKEIIDATVKSNELTGGRLGKVSIFHFCVKRLEWAVLRNYKQN